jgi:hypothetical protein
MTDRELLEAAAKAEGHAYPWVLPARGGERPWNPLTDNGDALELAVKLKLCIDHDYVETGTFTFNGVTEGEYEAGVKVWRIIPKEPNINDEEVYGNDPLAATRRAIVRAAAEIGRNTK